MSTLLEALRELKEEKDEYKTKGKLPPELEPYFELCDVHDDPEVDYKYLKNVIKQLEGELGVKVLGILHLKDGYEDNYYEVDGTFYCDDGQAYFGVGEGPGAYRWFPKNTNALLDAIGVDADALTEKYCQKTLGDDKAGSIIYNWMINAGYKSTDDFCAEVIINLCMASKDEEDRRTVLLALGEDPEDYED